MKLSKKILKDKTIIVAIDNQESENRPLVFDSTSIPAVQKDIKKNLEFDSIKDVKGTYTIFKSKLLKVDKNR
jgi:hypothetical protein